MCLLIVGDEVWAVFDRDDHPKFKDAVTLCENKKVRVSRSIHVLSCGLS